MEISEIMQYCGNCKYQDRLISKHPCNMCNKYPRQNQWRDRRDKNLCPHCKHQLDRNDIGDDTK